jgi:hypothetical protein
LPLSHRAQISEQGDSYRRGLVLGLTMAEIVILIVFILLLALAALLAIEKEKRLTVEQQLANANLTVIELREKLSVFDDIAGGDDIDHLVRELIAARRTIKENVGIRSRLIEAQELAAKFERELKDMEKELDQALVDQSLFAKQKELVERYEIAAKENGFPTDPEKISDALREANELREALEASGGRALEEVLKENLEVLSEKNRLEGQLANAQQKLKTLGKGNEMPSCWATPEKGTVEYIYGVSVTSEGMILRETDLPHRDVDRKLLPTSGIILNQETTPAKFKIMTRPLWDWAVEKKCRFYVKIVDKTAPDEKDVYKRRLKSVEGVFYKHWKIYKNFADAGIPLN